MIPTDRMAPGQEAEALLAALRPYLQRQRDRALTTLIQHHREETLTEGIMRTGIATLAVLLTLEQDLSQAQRLGRKDAEELVRGHP